MRIEYIGHSGVLVELNNINLIFDCIAFDDVTIYNSKGSVHDVGKMPLLDKSKETVFFASHVHGDHYVENIWNMRYKLNNVDYVISKDIPFSSGVRKRLGIDEEIKKTITRVKNYTSQDINLSDGSTIHVQTIPATDEGVAYLVKADGRIIYHAGDHHLWMWEERGEEYMDNMDKVFRRTLSRLELEPGETIDLACLLLDGRLSPHTYDGMDVYLEMLPIKSVLPIHQWQEYHLTDEYIRDRADKLQGITMLKVIGENCSFEI